MNIFHPGKAAVLLLVACLLMPSIADAQLFNKDKEIPADSSLVPDSAFAAFSIRPQTLVKHPRLSAFPREIVSATTIKEVGFDPLLIEEAVFLLTDCKDGGLIEDPPRWAWILRFSQMQGLSEETIQKSEKTKIKGYTAYVYESYPNKDGFLIYDDATMIFGDATFIEEIVSKPKGDLAKLMQDKKVNGEVMGFVDMRSLGELFKPIMEEMPNMSPPVEDLKDLPNLIDAVTFGTSTTNRLRTDIVMYAKSPQAAEEAAEIITNGLQYAHSFLIAELQKQMDMSDPVQEATVQYVDRIWNKYEEKMIPEVSGNKMKITLHEEVLALPFLGSFGIMSADQAMATNVMSTKTKARMIALCTLNYESAYRKFPPHTVRDENGRVLYSGRVKMLPFLDQSNLYEQFDKEKAWDSPENKELSETMILTFSGSSGRGMIRFPVFPGSIWDSEEGIELGDITDGTSNTILGIEAPLGSEISWADPTPWKISATNPMKDVFGDREEVTAVFADGSSQTLKKAEMTNEKLKALLTRGGGEVVER